MVDDAKIRVRLDTRQAKGELRGLVRESGATALRVSAGVRSAIGRGLAFTGASVGIGAGVAAVRGATQSGVGDIIGDVFGGVGADLNEFFLGDLDDTARAKRAAREETIAAFGAITGRTGTIPPGAKTFFDGVEALRRDEERGRSLIEQDDRFRGPGIDEFLDRIMEGIGTLVSEAVDALAEKLNPFDGK